MEARNSVRRRFGSCRASNPLDRYKNATPFPVQRLINNDWQWRRSEKSAVLCLRRNSLSRRNPTRDGIAARGRTRCAQRPMRSQLWARCIPAISITASWPAEWIKAAPPTNEVSFQMPSRLCRGEARRCHPLPAACREVCPRCYCTGSPR